MSAASVLVRARLRAAVRRTVTSILDGDLKKSASGDRQAIALEPLETRILFGYWGLYGPAFTNGCTNCPCPTPISSPTGPGPTGPGPSGPGPSVGPGPSLSGGSGPTGPQGPTNGPAPAIHTMAPVTAFDGMPVITSNDLESTPFGITWGIDRTWVGMDDTGSVGNGWSIAQMPYLTVTEPGYSYSSLGVLNSEAQPEDRISLVEGGNATYTFAISPPTGDSSQYKSFASADGEPYSLVTGTDSGTLAFVDAAGDVSEFYDVKRDSSNANRPIPSTYDPTHMYWLFYK